MSLTKSTRWKNYCDQHAVAAVIKGSECPAPVDGDGDNDDAPEAVAAAAGSYSYGAEEPVEEKWPPKWITKSRSLPAALSPFRKWAQSELAELEQVIRTQPARDAATPPDQKQSRLHIVEGEGEVNGKDIGKGKGKEEDALFDGVQKLSLSAPEPTHHHHHHHHQQQQDVDDADDEREQQHYADKKQLSKAIREIKRKNRG